MQLPDTRFDTRNEMMTSLPPPYRLLQVLQRSEQFVMESHSHNFYHVNFITSGYLLVEFEGAEHRVAEGQAIVLPPHIPHRLSAPDGYCQIGIDIIGLRDERGLYDLFCRTFPGGFAVVTMVNLPRSFESLYKAIRNLTPLNNFKLLNAADTLLLAVIEQSTNIRNPNFRERFVEMVSNENAFTLNLQQMCGIMNMSRSHLERLTLSEFGCGAMEYCNKLKLMKSCLLLQDTDMPLREISDNLGFYDQSHFNGFFKKRMGVTPNQYRNNSRQMV